MSILQQRVDCINTVRKVVAKRVHIEILNRQTSDFHVSLAVPSFQLRPVNLPVIQVTVRLQIHYGRDSRLLQVINIINAARAGADEQVGEDLIVFHYV